MESAATIKQVRERDQLRRIFNRTATTVEALIGDQNLLQARIDIDFLQDKFTRLETLQNSIQDSMLGSDKYDEAEFAKEIDMADKFRYRWCTIRNQVQTGISKDNTVDQTVDKKQLRNLRLPHLEVKKFDDNPKNWLAFWGQFKKINEDKDIIEVDKFQYLIQSLKEDSSARALVESFPPSAENYIKAIEQLQARFGREDLLIQVYVRELLGLVLNNNKDSISVRELYDKLSTYLLSLETLGIVKQKYETILYPLVESAIPETILVAWNRSKADHSKDQLANLLNFLKSEVETEERIKLARSEFNCARTNTTFHRESGSSLPTAASLVSNVKQKESGKELNTCCFCDKGGHNSLECSKGNKMSLDDKKEAIKGKGCCYICLKKGHMANRCKLFIKCIACNKRHFTILCPELHRRENTKAPPENVLVCARSNTTTLLQTLVVNITHKGKSKKVRVLLDSGSQRSYVKAALAKELGLQQTGTEKIGHTLFGGVERPAQVYKCYDIMVSSLDNSFVTKINALQQSEICGHLPKIKTMYLSKKLQNLNIKISDFDYPDTEIGILVGSDFLGSIITNKLVNLGNNLIAVYTYLGWTLQGPIEVQSTVNTISVSCFSKSNLEDLWSVELLGIQDPYEKQSRKETETDILNVFNNNISVNAQGRYEVSLLWKEGCPGLSTNYEVACKRLESTTKKLKSTGNLKIYNHVLQEWKKDDIIEKVTDDNTEVGHYIPHHSVIKPSSTSTRVRPVYDASAKDKNGWSLNSCLNKGINMIELLPKLLIQFRKGAYGVVSDIKQAFLQIAITEKDRNYLKFLWWDDIETCDKIVTYRHKRVVFGITCSPFLLSATIRYHLERCADAQKHTANKLKESFYVDNCVTSFETVDELNTFITESRTIMAEGMFDLRAWVTAPHRIGDSVSVPVLGMTWNTLQDDLRCNVNIKETTPQKITKRYVISVAQHVFDPLGFVCCATLIPKLVMQKIWEHKVDWDQEIPTDLAQEFKNWLKTAHLINKCSFPRHLSAAPVEECETSLHIFSDACQTSFAGCLFLRTQLNKKVEVQLVLAKNRVAPANRKMTLPRLELMGALIASRLYKEVIDSGLLAHCTNYKVYFWTDSAVVLAWIKRNNQWKTFVSNRVEEICTTTHRDDWHHIPGEFNQADLPSRGCDAKKLLESRWWEGPAWLKLDINNWPKSSISNVNEEDVQAEASQNIMVNTNIMPVELFSQRLMHFSKYNRIVRLVAWILRMSCNVRRKFNVKQPDITNDEYINAEKSLFKLLQRENFTPEKLPKNLNTELDTEGILKVKTRLDLGEEDRNFVQPVLLPGRNEIVQRLIRQRHEKLNHAGTQLIMTDLRSNLWILNLRRVAKSTVSKCVICRRYKAKRYEVPEAPLPADRIDTKAVFEVTGIDLAGPLYLRDQGKCWIVLFTCATYRAVHLELVESLSTNSFLMALRRFIARRGRVRVIYTDCGGNFQGTSNLLNTVRWTEVEAASATLVTPIRWRFLPPRTPWWGGWWERLIKILKDMLRRILGKESVTWIELSTLLCDCEAVMNSRPLTYVATTDDCLTPLTPMMFLHSLPSSDTPDLDQIDDKNMNIRLQYLHKLRDDFRCRFRKEYLGLLCSKDKCKQNLPKVNDIVLIETDSSRLYWPLGIIKELLAGTDGHSRVAKVQTATGEWIRAVQRLYPLELSAVTDEWQRTIASTKGKPESDYLSQQVSPDANSNSDLSDDVRPTSTSTKRGRIVKVPRRFLD